MNILKSSATVRAACSLLLGAALAAPSHAQSRPSDRGDWRQKREFIYFLPRTLVVAKVGQRLLSCPVTGDDEPGIETEIAIVDEQVPDVGAMVRVDGRSGFLAKRTTKLTLRPDGTLEAFNAATEGQGGDVLAAAVKVAVTAGTLAMGSPAGLINVAGYLKDANFGEPEAETGPPPHLVCKDATKKTLATLADVDAQIAMLEELVSRDEADSAQVQLLADRKTARADLRKALTLTSAPISFDIKARPATAAKLTQLVPPLDYKQWFVATNGKAGEIISKLAGSSGFVVTLSPDAPMFAALAGDGSTLPGAATPYLFYRRPIKASIAVRPCMPGAYPAAPTPDCAIDSGVAGKKASSTKDVLFPQLSGLYAIPIGRGGLFGTRQASAKFNASGAPLELEYGSGAGGADIAKVLGAANDGMVTLRDADLTAWERAAREMTARKTYEEAKEKLDELGRE
jgi:hypothetical protein